MAWRSVPEPCFDMIPKLSPPAAHKSPVFLRLPQFATNRSATGFNLAAMRLSKSCWTGWKGAAGPGSVAEPLLFARPDCGGYVSVP